MNLQDQIDTMIHFRNGGRVQVKTTDKVWVRIQDPSWSWSKCDYRIDPTDLIEAVADELAEAYVIEQNINGLHAISFKHGFLAGADFLMEEK